MDAIYPRSPLQDAIEDSSLRCIAIQGQLYALANSYRSAEQMSDELFEAILWGIGRDLDGIKNTLDRVPYQREEASQ